MKRGIVLGASRSIIFVSYYSQYLHYSLHIEQNGVTWTLETEPSS